MRMIATSFSVVIDTSRGLPASSDSAARRIDSRITPNSIPIVVISKGAPSRAYASTANSLGIHNQAGNAALVLVNNVTKGLA